MKFKPLLYGQKTPGTRIDLFHGKYGWLSNFYTGPSFIWMDGLEYPSVEHAYQAAKTLHYPLRDQFTVHHISSSGREYISAGTAKRIGQTLPLRSDWESVKLQVMENLLREKFSNPSLKQKLLDTGTAELVEGNSWGDRFWGVDGTGENHLGRLLMKLRDEYSQASKQDPEAPNWCEARSEATVAPAGTGSPEA